MRLGITALAAQRVRDWQELEGVSVEEWFIRLGGKNTYHNIWRPMLAAGFDRDFRNVPATVGFRPGWLVRVRNPRGKAPARERAPATSSVAISPSSRRWRNRSSRRGAHSPCDPGAGSLHRRDRATGVRLAHGVHTFDAVAGGLPGSADLQTVDPWRCAEYHEFLGKTDYLWYCLSAAGAGSSAHRLLDAQHY